MEEKATTATGEETTGAAIVTEKAPMVLLEILVQGVEDDKPIIKKMLDGLQEQMGKSRKGKHVRVLWLIDKGEQTVEQKKKWLTENCNAKYNYFVPDNYEVKSTFVKDALVKIHRFEEIFRTLKEFGIKPSTGRKNKIDTELQLEKMPEEQAKPSPLTIVK